MVNELSMLELLRSPIDAKKKAAGRTKRGVSFIIAFLICLIGQSSAQVPQSATPELQPQAVTLDGKRLFDIRIQFKGATPAERAKMNSERIRRFADDWSINPASITSVETDISSDIMAGDRVIMSLLELDAQAEGRTRAEMAADYAIRIRTAIEQYRQDYGTRRIMIGSLLAVLTTLILIIILIAGIRAYKRLLGSVLERVEQKLASSRFKSLQWPHAGQIRDGLTGGLNLIRTLILLGLLYTYFQLLLSYFPWTRGLADRLLSIGLAPLKTLANTVWDQVPNLFFVVVVAIITGYVLKVLRVFFSAIDNGTIKFQNFYQDWGTPTYKIVRIFVIVFAVMIAYPYIPGSNSDAFKGISIFLGVLFSLGSTSLIGNVIAGLMMTYIRAFKVGDRVKIGEYTGEVLAMRLQVTHLRTSKNEEIVVPNSVVINSHVLNYSSMVSEGGLILHTSVTIGYDTPWRQVHALLLMAAERTAGLLRDPLPYVLQTSLDDFYVSYELNVYTDAPRQMLQLYSALHQNIQDAFNEYGVQIMSPNYEADREVPTVVPKDKWYEAPAKPPKAEK